MSNYTKTNIGNEARAELHETLSLTGAEVSINSLPAGASVPLFILIRTMKKSMGLLTEKERLSLMGILSKLLLVTG